VKNLRPEIWGASQTCLEERISHNVFNFSNASIDVISNLGIWMIEGEINYEKGELIEPVEDLIEKIETEGMWGTKAKPCKVVEKHIHDGNVHLHFKCSSFDSKPETSLKILKELIKISSEAD